MNATRRSVRRRGVAWVGALLVLAGILPAGTAAFTMNPATVWINEIHYDNTGTDAGEAIEVAGPAGTDLSAWSIVLYNGSGGAVYDTDALSGTIPDQQNGFGTVVIDYPSNGIQNGSPDGIALVNGTIVVQFLSYEGSFTAVGSPADGIVSTDIGVAETGSEALGQSLQLGGTGSTYQAFTWASPAASTFGQPNTTQTLTLADAAPSVASTSPADGATGVASNSVISITFSEAVNLQEAGVTLECSAGPVAGTLAGGPVTFTLSPLPMPDGICTLTIAASAVADQDVDDPPDNMAANFMASFTVGAAPVTITPIHSIQTAGASSAPGTYTIEAVVVGDYQTQGSGQLRGFFVQEEDADADADSATSEGLFVFCSSCPVTVAVGDQVRVTGDSSEFFDMSQLTATTSDSVSVISSGNPLPTPANVDLPVPGVPTGDLTAARAAINAYFEAFEGMLVTFPDALSVSEYFELARYGQVVLREGGRPHTFTAVSDPSESGLIDHTIDLARRTIILDDTDNRQNRPVDSPNTPYYHPVPGLSTSNYFRGGDTISSLTGVLHWSFAGQTGTDAWRIRPVTEAFSYAFTPVNTRPSVPEVEGRLKVASFNVLNYFPTIDTTASSTAGSCGPTQTMDCRGADSAQEFDRQRTKLLAALSAIDADIFGLMEMENTPGVEPLANIVAGLPGYDYVDTGVTGTDAIRVGIIYKTATVQPVGAPAVLDTPEFVNPRGADVDRNRPAVAQAFEEIATGARLTVVVNHLKSKGSGCGEGDDDTTMGQGNCNLTRTLAAQALVEWLATDPTGSGDRDVLIIGDLNSYAKEDPIRALEASGYTNLVAQFGGSSAYSFVFDGQLGYLDHALANSSLLAQVAGVAEWHINADEVPLFDFNDDVRDAGEAAFEEESDTFPLYEPNAVRTSDHDPVIIGLDLDTLNAEFSDFAPPLAGGEATARAGSTVSVRFDLGGVDDLDVFAGEPVTYVCGSPGEDLAPAASVGGGLRYDASTGQFVFGWKTDRAWAGSCRTLEFALDDGTFATIDVTFRR